MNGGRRWKTLVAEREYHNRMGASGMGEREVEENIGGGIGGNNSSIV